MTPTRPPKSPPSDPRAGHGEGAPEGPRAPLDSGVLFAGRDEVVIRHNGRDYRLRRTRLGKLILTA